MFNTNTVEIITCVAIIVVCSLVFSFLMGIKVKEYEDQQKIVESSMSFVFTSFRIMIAGTICFIFLEIDFKILAFIRKVDLTNLTFTPENLTILKYGFLFLVSQLVIFSQGFGFSSIVKLMQGFSSKKNAKDVKEATNVEN